MLRCDAVEFDAGRRILSLKSSNLGILTANLWDFIRRRRNRRWIPGFWFRDGQFEGGD